MPAKKKELLTVFVTGATGRLGRYLIKALTENGDTVRALSINKEEVRKLFPGAIPFVGNLTDIHVLDDACNGADVVIHLAAVVGEAGARTEDLIRSNVEGTKNILEACKKNNIKHLIFTSAVEVYGRKRNVPLDEKSTLLPSDRYGYSKMLAEQEVINSHVPYTILRIAKIYGIGFGHAFFKIFRALKEGRMAIVGNGNNHLALIHINDVINAMMLVINNPDVCKNEIYNLTDGENYTQEHLMEIGAELLGVSKPRVHMREFVLRMLARQRNLDSDELRFLTSDRIIKIDKIKKELKFRPSIDLHTGGKELINAFLSGAKEN